MTHRVSTTIDAELCPTCGGKDAVVSTGSFSTAPDVGNEVCTQCGGVGWVTVWGTAPKHRRRRTAIEQRSCCDEERI